MKPDPNALGLTAMHGYIIAAIFVLVFLAAVVTVIVLTCCLRRRRSLFHGPGSVGGFPWSDKTGGKPGAPFDEASHRMLPDGGDSTYSPSRAGFGSSLPSPLMHPAGHFIVQPTPTPASQRASLVGQPTVMVDEHGQLVTLLKRPNSVAGDAFEDAGSQRFVVFPQGGPQGNNIPMVLLGAAPSPAPSGYFAGTAPTVRRMQFVEPCRPGSSNTVASDRISLGSGSDRFSVQSGTRGPPQPGLPPVVPGVGAPQGFFPFPRKPAPQHVSPVPGMEMPPQVAFRHPAAAAAWVAQQERTSLAGHSMGNLSATGKCLNSLSCIGSVCCLLRVWFTNNASL